MFAVVATAFSVTQWHNVPGNSSGIIRAWIGQWYPVIHRQRMPQALWSTANSAAVVKVFQCIDPVLFCKRKREITFPVSAMSFTDFYQFPVLPLVLSRSRTDAINILGVIFGVVLFFFFFVCLIVLCYSGFNLFSVLQIPSATILFALFHCFVTPSLALGTLASFTQSVYATNAIFVFYKLIVGFRELADAANFCRRHSELTFAYSHKVCSQSGVSTAFSLIGLDYIRILPHNGDKIKCRLIG